MTASDPTEAADAPSRTVVDDDAVTRPLTVTPSAVDALFAEPTADAAHESVPAFAAAAPAPAPAPVDGEPASLAEQEAPASLDEPETASHPAEPAAAPERQPLFLTDPETEPLARLGGPAPVLTAEPAPTSAPTPVVLPPAALSASSAPLVETQWADESRGATALTWVDPAIVADRTATPASEEAADARTLMRGARLRSSFWRPGVLTPLCVLVGLVGVYVGGTLLWPLHELPPTVEAVALEPAAVPPAVATWPGEGSGSVGVSGFTTIASTPDAVSIASITKVVSSLMVLDRMPLAIGEQGPEFSFTDDDSDEYWDYLRSDQSALDVPVDGVLTEYQLLQGTLLASANNYIDRLAAEIWGSDRRFAEAAEVWLRERNLQGITIVTPSGFDEGNVATPEALIRLGQYAMKNPVFAEIVATPAAEIPGAGLVTNTNGLLADPGVVGIKTGTLVGWNLLAAKDVVVGEGTVRIYATALNQPDAETRLAATRSLFAEVEATLAAQPPVVTRATVAGVVTTAWGEKVQIVTDADATVVLWNGAAAQATAELDLTDDWEAGAAAGTLTTTGPVNSVITGLSLAAPIEGPSAWWRLTHPLDLLGLTDAQR